MLQRNTFMNWLATDPKWGASDNEKRPLFLGDFLKTNDPRNIRLATKDTLESLPTLNELDGHPSLLNVNRAYRLHASDNLVVSFDIEPSSDPSYLTYFAAMPAHYAEYSRNNGIHLYYRLKRTKLSPAALAMIMSATVYKYPNKTADELNIPRPELPFTYELIMNNHWVTFTEKFIPDTTIDLDDDAPDEIYQMIESAAWVIKQKTDLSSATMDVEFNPTELSEKLATLIRENTQKMDEVYALSYDDYLDGSGNPDKSVYEFACAARISHILIKRLKYPRKFDAMFLDMPINEIPLHDKINAVLEVLLEVIPEREKHTNHIINGVPYLMWIIQKAYYGAENPNQ